MYSQCLKFLVRLISLYCIFTNRIEGAARWLAFPLEGSVEHRLLVQPFHKLCIQIKQITDSNREARTCSCFISRAYPEKDDSQQVALNTWCNAFNATLQKAGFHTFYDEFGSHKLDTEIYPFINQIGVVNAVFPLLTPCFKRNTERRVGWLFDEVQCYTARQTRNPHGCYPILLAGTKEISVPEQLLPLENNYYYTMAKNNADEIPWPTTFSFLETMLEILTPDDKGLTRWTKRDTRYDIEKAISNFKRETLKEHTPERQLETIPSANLHDLIVPFSNTKHLSMVENVSHMIDSFYHKRHDHHGENYVGVISRELKCVAQDPNPQLVRALHICGIGGVGKTYLARHFAYKSFQKKTYDLIWWFDDDNFEESIKKLYKAMITANFELLADLTDYNSQFFAIQSALNVTTKSWLLIYDNISVKTLSHTQIFKSTNRNGHILTTARHVNKGRILILGEFTQKEATDYLQHHIEQTNEEKCKIQISLIDYVADRLLFRLPLALAQAASYIAAQNISVEQYIEEFSQNTTNILNYENESEFSVPIYKSLIITLEKISPKACALFFMLCFMPADDVPIYIFEKIVNEKHEFVKIYQELQNQRLITISGNDFFLFSNIHRLCQFIGKKIFLAQSNSNTAEKTEQIYRDIVNCWNVFLENFQKEKIQLHTAKKWYVLFKAFTKCAEKSTFSPKQAQKIDGNNPLYEDPSFSSGINFLPICFSITDILEFILSNFQNEPDFEQLIWEEVGIPTAIGENIKNQVHEMSMALKCSKLVMYKILKEHGLVDKKILQELNPYMTNNNCLWDIEFFLKILGKITHSKHLSDTIIFYTDIIMFNKPNYPGLASLFALYIFHKTQIKENFPINELHKMFDENYFLQLYLKTEQHYSCSEYIDQIEMVTLTREFQELYKALLEKITLHKVVCYIPILYCYEKFGMQFVINYIERIDILIGIFNNRNAKDVITTQREW